MKEVTKPIIRLVRKRPYNEQFFFDQDASALPSLAASSVRIQATQLGLSSNNLSYCALGDALHWFDVYPVPRSLPDEYTKGDHAVSPGWGFCKVLESTIEGLKPGTDLHGMIPTSTMICDLKLKPADVTGHWIENSSHRDKVESIYCRYNVVNTHYSDSGLARYANLWTSALFVTWKSGYLLNRYVFTSRPEDPVISMFPSLIPWWSRTDADLSNAIVITLGSGSRTCRSFVHQLATNRAANSGPLAVYEVTGSTGTGLSNLTDLPFKHKLLKYQEVSTKDTLEQITDGGAKKVVILDFGGRGDTKEHVVELLRTMHPSINVTVVNIGSTPKVYSDADLRVRAESATKLGALQMHATNLLDAVYEEIGEEQTYDLIHQEWHRVLEQQYQNNAATGRANEFLGMALETRNGVREGVGKIWDELCGGNILNDAAYVVKF